MKVGISLMVLVGSGLVAVATLAEPAAETSPTTSATGSSESLDEVVVTARRREELLEDVPQTISAV